MNYLEEFKFIPIDIRISPLILACHLGRNEIVKLLLGNKKTDINFSSDDASFTPLMVACMAGQCEIVELLLQFNVNIKLQCKGGKSAFYYCFSRLDENNNHFENHRICIRMAQLLLDKGADVNEIVDEKKGLTMLMIFCKVKIKLNRKEKDVNLNIIKFLLENGANINMKTKKGKTIFDLCQKHCNIENLL